MSKRAHPDQNNTPLVFNPASASVSDDYVDVYSDLPAMAKRLNLTSKDKEDIDLRLRESLQQRPEPLTLPEHHAEHVVAAAPTRPELALVPEYLQAAFRRDVYFRAMLVGIQTGRQFDSEAALLAHLQGAGLERESRTGDTWMCAPALLRDKHLFDKMESDRDREIAADDEEDVVDVLQRFRALRRAETPTELEELEALMSDHVTVAVTVKDNTVVQWRVRIV